MEKIIPPGINYADIKPEAIENQIRIIKFIHYLIKIRDLSTDKRITHDMSTHTATVTPTIVTVIT